MAIPTSDKPKQLQCLWDLSRSTDWWHQPCKLQLQQMSTLSSAINNESMHCLITAPEARLEQWEMGRPALTGGQFLSCFGGRPKKRRKPLVTWILAFVTEVKNGSPRGRFLLMLVPLSTLKSATSFLQSSVMVFPAQQQICDDVSSSPVLVGIFAMPHETFLTGRELSRRNISPIHGESMTLRSGQ